jgi:BON domain-containing protein
MSPFRYRDDDASSGTVMGVLVGAIAGFTVGMLVAQRVGGFGGLRNRLRKRGARRDELAETRHADAEDYDEFETDEFEGDEGDTVLEERVLEAFRNDPILAERAVDIGSIGEGVIELAGWVDTEDEAEHAVTLAGGVPGVNTVVNRMAIGDEEERFEESARRFESGDPALTEARWEGTRVGTGRRRQGTSDEPDRHATPRVELEERWLNESEAVRNSAESTEGIAERRRYNKRAVRGDRTGGAPVAPTGVPKGDHVANPREADARVARTDAAREAGGEQTDFGQRP